MYSGKQKISWASGYIRGMHDVMDVIMLYDFLPDGMMEDFDRVEANASRLLRDAQAAREDEETTANLPKDMKLLRDILQNCQQIGTVIDEWNITEQTFKQKFFYRNAIAMSLYWICECTKQLSEVFRQKHPQIPWDEIAKHDIIAENSDDVTFCHLWELATEQVPKLREFCEHGLMKNNIPLPEPEPLVAKD